MGTPLSPSQVAIVKSTVPLLAQYGEAITTKFYHDLLLTNPSLKNVFNTTHQATGHQARALASALYAYASNLSDLGKLAPAVELICHKHASLGISASQYGIVGEGVLSAMRAVLGEEVCTAEVLDAWGAAYWQLANVMISKEAELYERTAYWEGWQDFRIARKEVESEEITSFYLTPVDAGLEVGKVKWKPGQYVSVRVWVEELDGGIWQARQYSLSSPPGRPFLRISVKKEPGTEVGEPEHVTRPGYISNLLHDKKNVGDVVKVSHPFGDFFFDGETVGGGAPVVLISAGVGLTCLMSILESVVEGGSTRPVTWIHGSRDKRVRAMKNHIDELAAKNKNIHKVYFSSSPAEDEVQGRDYDVKGRVDLEKVEKEWLYIGDGRTQYYTCGPTSFMLDVEEKLKSFGVGSERVHMELFGTGGVPRSGL